MRVNVGTCSDGTVCISCESNLLEGMEADLVFAATSDDPTERAEQKRLAAWIENAVNEYAETRGE